MIKDQPIPATNAVIYLKSGKRKYGVLIENNGDCNASYKFISHGSNYNSENFIELVATELIEAIDINPK